MSKTDLVVYSVFFVSKVRCLLTIESKQLVIQGEAYLWESPVTLSVCYVQYLTGKQFFTGVGYFFPKTGKTEW